MVKVIVFYDTKYGNTKLVAEKIVEGMREVEGIETAISDVEGVDLDRIGDYDAILIDSPNHYGGPTGDVKKFIDKVGKLNLEGILFAVFDTYLGKCFFKKAVKKMEKRINEKVPGLKQIAPELSIEVQGMKGPLVEGELSKCKEFGKKIATEFNLDCARRMEGLTFTEKDKSKSATNVVWCAYLAQTHAHCFLVQQCKES